VARRYQIPQQSPHPNKHGIKASERHLGQSHDAIEMRGTESSSIHPFSLQSAVLLTPVKACWPLQLTPLS
jgi:hypothetical protein